MCTNCFVFILINNTVYQIKMFRLDHLIKEHVLNRLNACFPVVFIIAVVLGHGSFTDLDLTQNKRGRSHESIFSLSLIVCLRLTWWLGWAMVLGSFQYRGVLLLLHIVGQGPAVLAAGAGRVGYIFSSNFPF